MIGVIKSDRQDLQRHRGAALLEVVLSVGVLVTAMAFVAAGLRGGLVTGERSRDQIDAMMLAETALAELDMGYLSAALEQQEFDHALTGDFGQRYPGYAWQVTIDESTIEGMYLVSVSILKGRPIEKVADDENQEDQTASDQEKAQLDEYTDFREIYTVRTLRPEKIPMDMNQIVGEQKTTAIADRLSENDQIAELLGTLGIDIEMLDGIDLPALLQQMPMEDLLEYGPMLNRMFGGAFGGSMWSQVREGILKYQAQQSAAAKDSEDPNAPADPNDPNSSPEGEDAETGDQSDKGGAADDQGGSPDKSSDVGQPDRGAVQPGDNQGRPGGQFNRRGGDRRGGDRQGGDRPGGTRNGGRRGGNRRGGGQSDGAQGDGSPSLDELIHMAEEAGGR